MRKGILSGIVFWLLAAGFCPAQVQQDFQSWIGLQINKDLPKKFSASATVQMRRYNNLSMLRQLYGQLDGSFKINKYLEVTLGGRYIFTNTINSLRLFNDWAGSYSLKLDGIGLDKYKIDFTARLRFQQEITNIPKPGFTLRPKLKAQLVRKKWKVLPWIAWENYFGDEYDGIEHGKSRFFIGADIDLPKNFSLSCFYIFQKAVNTDYPVNAHIAGLMLQYKWEKKKKKTADENGAD